MKQYADFILGAIGVALIATGVGMTAGIAYALGVVGAALIALAVWMPQWD